MADQNGVGEVRFRGVRTGAVLRRRYKACVTNPRNCIRDYPILSVMLRSVIVDAFTENIENRNGDAEPTKLIVSNLNFQVTKSDIQALFSDFGKLLTAAVHYDQSGRFLGTADVVFERRADAIKAMKRYNGVPLFGTKLNIQLAPPVLKTGSETSPPTGGDRQARENSKRRRRDQRRSQGRNGGRASRWELFYGKRPILTAEQLDAQMDAYVEEIKDIKISD